MEIRSETVLHISLPEREAQDLANAIDVVLQAMDPQVAPARQAVNEGHIDRLVSFRTAVTTELDRGRGATMSHVYEQVPGDPAIRVCVTHDPEFGLYGDEECHAGEPGYAAHAWRDIADMLAARLETHMPFAAGDEGEEDAAALRVYQGACRAADGTEEEEK